MYFLRNKKIQRTIACLLLTAFIISPFSQLQTSTTYAYEVVESGPALGAGIKSAAANAKTSVETTVSAFMNSVSAAALKSLGIKEWGVDKVGWALAKMALSAGIRSTAQWIRSGFQGAPLFVTDPGAFLLNIADEKAGEILYGSTLGFLCSPINIRIALNFYYQSIRNRNPLRCTLTGAAANIERFVNGTFSSGGWPSWLDVSVNPVNSSMGGALSGQIALVTNINTQQQEKQRQWSASMDFLSSEECTTGSDGVKKCVKVSPGKVIADTMSFGVQVGDRSLIEADEINEVISALMGQMLIAGLKGVKGLFGLGQTGGYSSSYSAGFDAGAPLDVAGNIIPCAQRSYLDQMSNPECDPTLSSADTSTTFSGAGSIFQAIGDEESFQAMHRRIINAATAVIKESEKRGAKCSINDSIIDDARGYISAASSTILASQARVLELQALEARTDHDDDTEKQKALLQLANMVGNGSIRTGAENIRELDSVENTLKEINNNSDIQKPDSSLRSRIKDCPPDPDTNTPPPTTDTGGNEGGGGGDGG